jgi:hypothetical protein
VTRVRAPAGSSAPSAEQCRIADELDELLSDLDAAVAGLEGVQAKLKLYRVGVEGRGGRRSRPIARRAVRRRACVGLQRILNERRRRWEQDQLARFKPGPSATEELEGEIQGTAAPV